MNECHRSSEHSWRMDMRCDHENTNNLGLGLLAEVAVSNYITSGKDKEMNDSPLLLHGSNVKKSMQQEAEIFLQKRNSLDVELENKNGSVVTDNTEFSDHGDFGCDTSYQVYDEMKDEAVNSSISYLTSSIISGDYIDYSQPSNFVSMLMDVLSSTSMESVITWLPSGDAFIVLNEEEFTKYVLPTFFELIKFESFVKRLYRFGFKSTNLGSKNKVFYHKYFLRDFPNISSKISQCNSAIDPLSFSGVANNPMNLNALSHKDLIPQLLNSSDIFGDRRHRLDMQLNLRTYRRSSSMSHVSNTNNLNSNLCADVLIKNFFDRKMDKIRSQYVTTPSNQSHSKKFKRHSMGF